MNVIMIMAHRDLAHVKRLIAQCLCADTRVVLHLDQKMVLAPGDLEGLLATPGVYAVQDRLSGALDDRSLVDIAMVMIETALAVEEQEHIHFAHYLLLSGQDYPTRPMWYITRELEKAYPAVYIDCTPYDRRNWLYYKFRENDGYRRYRQWILAHFPRRTMFRKMLRLTSMMYRRAAEWLHRTDYDRLKELGCALYGGSAWWILPDQVIRFIRDEYVRQPEYVQILLRSFTPEETFFQTVAMRSDLAADITVNPPDMVAQNCKTWAYFSGEGKPFRGHPYIFTADEYEKLIQRDCYFARKFDSEQSAEVLQQLDAYLRDLKEP